MKVHAPLAAVTVATQSRIPQARCLMDSVATFLPDVERVVLLVDGQHQGSLPEEKLRVTPAEALGISGFRRMAFEYSPLELSASLKPFILQSILSDPEREAVIYLDSDTLLYRRPVELLRLLKSEAIVLLPHLVSPRSEAIMEEVRLRPSGVFNTGMVAVKRSDEGHSFLSWWATRLKEHCLFESQRGFNIDQGWMDFAPGYFTHVAVLRDASYNVAYWNRAERSVSLDEGNEPHFCVNGAPLTMFHFSGFDPDQPLRLSTHERISRPLDEHEPLGRLTQAYARAAIQLGYHDAVSTDYSYARFSNGIRIPQCARVWFRRLPGEMKDRWIDPFSAGSNGESFFDHLNNPWREEPLLTCCAAAFYFDQEKNMALFPRVPGPDSLAYARWFASGAASQHDIASEFARAQRRVLSAGGAGARVARRTRWDLRSASLRLARRASGSPLLKKWIPPRVKAALWRYLVGDPSKSPRSQP